MQKIALALSFLLVSSTIHALDSNVCHVTYKPDYNKSSFVPIGKALISATKTCVNDALIIPYNQVSQAITLQEGIYPGIFKDKNILSFSTKAYDNKAKIVSCSICDPIDSVLVNIKKPDTLCVKSSLNVISCAKSKTLSYSFTKKTQTTNLPCTKSLVYLGISNETLKFKYITCDDKDDLNKGDELLYDLYYGRKIRMLNEVFEIEEATNLGLKYKRIPNNKEDL